MVQVKQKHRVQVHGASEALAVHAGTDPLLKNKVKRLTARPKRLSAPCPLMQKLTLAE